MVDYNKNLTTGDVESGVVNAVVEIPLGGLEKFEWNRANGKFELDPDRPTDIPEPANYGFIPRTRHDDGDELDVLVLGDKPIETGTSLQVKVVAVMRFRDEGVVDDKIITVPVGEKSINGLQDISSSKRDEITNYFEHYKDYKGPGQTVVGDWQDAKSAKEIIVKAMC